MVLVQHQKNDLGAPDTQGVFEKYLEALANIKELVQLWKNHLRPPGTPGVFEKYLEALANIMELVETLEELFRISKSSMSL